MPPRLLCRTGCGVFLYNVRFGDDDDDDDADMTN